MPYGWFSLGGRILGLEATAKK